jgi:photosystem II stability/assembly factor-like uncharacterized protein
MKKISFLLFVLLIFCVIERSSAQYVEQSSGVNLQLTSVSSSLINSSYIGWICGDSGTVLRTTNMGYNWVNVSVSGNPSSVTMVNIFGIDANNAITAGVLSPTTWVWKTTNGGTNWNIVFIQQGGCINSIWMKNTSIGIMVGNPVGGRWSIWKTTNGGLNWDSAGLYLAGAGENGFRNALYCDSNWIWFGTNNCKIYRSTNFGSSWSVQSTGTEQNIYSLCFYLGSPNGTGFAGGANLLKTTNGGLNWFTQPSIGSGNISGITYGMWIWLIRSGPIIYFNNSSKWQTAYTAPAGNFTHMSSIKSVHKLQEFPIDLSFWAVRSNGGITHFRYVEGIIKLGTDIPYQFSLSQNYPNPFNPVTKIKFSIPLSRGVSEGRGVLVKLLIYDILGREIATLVNEQLQPGTYEVEWDGSNYPSGVYFYQLSINNEQLVTKKMVLIK